MKDGRAKGWQAYAGYCYECCKKTYWTRRQARSAARAIDKSMSAYPCGNLWHIGHLPPTIVLGWEARDEFRERDQRRRDAG